MKCRFNELTQLVRHAVLLVYPAALRLLSLAV